MAQAPRDPDDALLEELRLLHAADDPVPAVVRAAASAAIEFRDLDTQLAALIEDSAATDTALAGVRGGDARVLTFQLGGLFLELEVRAAGDHRTIVGALLPGDAPLDGAATVAVETPSGSRAAELDPHGRFRSDDLGPGPLRVRLRLPDVAFVTPWVSA
ncbi:MAG: hypothetical protein PGN13_12020 [Patulibacter minatonensis]